MDWLIEFPTGRTELVVISNYKILQSRGPNYSTRVKTVWHLDCISSCGQARRVK